MYKLEIINETPCSEMTDAHYVSSMDYLLLGRELALSIAIHNVPKIHVRHLGRVGKDNAKSGINISDQIIVVDGRCEIVPAQYMRDQLTDQMFLVISETKQMLKLPFTKNASYYAGGFVRAEGKWNRIILKKIASTICNPTEQVITPGPTEPVAVPEPVEQVTDQKIGPGPETVTGPSTTSEFGMKFILCNVCNFPQPKRVVTDCGGEWHATTCTRCYSKTSLCRICGIHRSSVKVSSETGMIDMVTTIF